ncbi:MAG: hypothetical protein DWQ04_26505 [Chloroflexi bacterium]|nr:MAG: hypothetical protein DWQ04_26505 [Chloroflexota bacterium]
MSEHSVLVDGRIVSFARSGQQAAEGGSAIKLDSGALAAAITRSASTQTYFTIKFLVDRPLVDDAYRAYAYFRWVDDYLDEVCEARDERLVFVERQRQLIARAYRGEWLGSLTDEERLVVDLVHHDMKPSSGLRAYIDNMMAVMAFDAERRGQLISGAELEMYTGWLATAVTEALHHFIGHNDPTPHDETRYLAVTAAHITHMLRDAVEDVEAGYYNIPQKVFAAQDLSPMDVSSEFYREWVRERVNLARRYFEVGRANMARIQNLRRRLAGYAYIARFEVVLDAIEKDAYRLRPDYPERKSKQAAFKMGWAAFSQAFKPAVRRGMNAPSTNGKALRA